jgi:hypothetical protein
MPDTLTPKPDNGGGEGPPEQHVKKQLPPGMAEKKWQPGQSGNPGGRRNGSVSLKKLLVKLLNEKNAKDPEGRKNAELFIFSEVARALKGDKDARRMIWEYVEGLPEAQVNVNAQGGFTVVLTTKPEDNGTAP